MKLNFQYKIFYSTGQVNDKKHSLSMDVSKENCLRIVQGVLSDTPLEEIEGIAPILFEMREQVVFMDSWYNLDGTLRKAKLKKPREIDHIEFSLSDEDIKRIRKMTDPITAFCREEERMTVYRSDGSSVEIRSEGGKVEVRDSRKKGSCTIMDADQFLSSIT